ncbi:MAG: autotransporter outer membrane beta-barrel domain-containing protein [Deltaproteobacteria bacterium]
MIKFKNRFQPIRMAMPVASILFLFMAMAVPAEAQATPEDSYQGALFGAGQICPRLNGIPMSSRTVGTQELINRCNELASSQDSLALRQISPEEIAAQGTNSVEFTRAAIGARIAALRLGVKGVALNIDDLSLPNASAVAFNSDSGAVADARFANSLTLGLVNQTLSEVSDLGRLGVFLNGEFNFGDKDATSRESGFDFNNYAATAGLDYRFSDNFFLGAALRFARTDIDNDDTATISGGNTVLADGGGLDINSYSVSIYGSYYLSNFYVDGIATVGLLDYDIERNISYNVGTPVAVTPESDTDGTQLSFSLGGGYDFSVGALTAGPLVQANYTRLDIDGYGEDDLTCQTNDAGGVINPGCGWALRFESQDVDSLTLVSGGQASYSLSTPLGVFLPQARFEWVHEFLDDARDITASFVNDPNGQDITIRTDNPDRDYFNLGGGISATLPYGISSFIYYETVLGLENITAHSIVGGIRIEL